MEGLYSKSRALNHATCKLTKAVALYSYPPWPLTRIITMRGTVASDISSKRPFFSACSRRKTADQRQPVGDRFSTKKVTTYNTLLCKLSALRWPKSIPDRLAL